MTSNIFGKLKVESKVHTVRKFDMVHFRAMKKICRGFMKAAKEEFKETLTYWNMMYLEQAEDMQELEEKCSELENKIRNLSSNSSSSDDETSRKGSTKSKGKGFGNLFKLSKTLQPGNEKSSRK